MARTAEGMVYPMYGTGSPSGVYEPKFIGEIYVDTDSNTLYYSTGLTNTDWVIIGNGTGDVIAPATNTADYIPQWDGANSKTLKNGLAIPAGGLAGLTEVGGKLNLDQSTQQTILNDSPLFSEGVEMANDKWLKSKDYAGTGYLNILKGNEDNEVDVGTQLNVGSIEAEEDSGAISLFDMAVSSASADGTEMSATIKIDGNNILKIYAESDGAGGADTFKVQLLNKAVLTMQDSAGTTHTYTADTDGSLIIS